MYTDNMQDKKISVIVPCYNVEKCVKKCVNSILKQKYKNLEIILVDDGSKDKTGMILDEFAKKDNRVKVIHKQSGGVSSARNEGILSATGDYISFIDGDDWIDKDMYEKLLSFAETKNVEIVSCGYVVERLIIKKRCVAPFEFNTVYDSDFIIQEILSNFIYRKKDITMALNNPVKLYKSSLLKDNNITYNEEWFHAEDIEFIVRLFLKTNSIAFLDFAPYHYIRYISLKTLTTRFFPYWFEQQMRYEKFIEGTLYPIYEKEIDYPKRAIGIMKYAHQDCMDIYKRENDEKNQEKYQFAIFTNKDYIDAVNVSNDSDLDEILLSEKRAVEKNDFEEWRNIAKKCM
ncbi:MAG: glycosyltransferase [Oscillospiraceae bacterium]|nr:glycosyltransferase [Candidatus Ruminococcus equi]